MSRRSIAWIAGVGALALVAVVLFSSAEDQYVLELRTANAGGLKDGSPVTIGGVRIGTVQVEVDAEEDVVVSSMEIEDRYAPLGRDTKATIVAQNLLGQKQVQLSRGSTDDPAPSGFVIDQDRLTEATDLDRVLSVLDAETRARLAIFVNEAGTAFTGRRADFNRFLRDIAPAIASATDVVGQLAADNEELGELVDASDRYVAEVAEDRGEVVRLVDRLGQAAVTGSAKRTELRQTLAQAPGSLRTLQTFLAELRSTTQPLRPAARDLSAVAGPLRETLDELEPFQNDAAPALRTARSVAPTLERLAVQAAPILRKAEPTAEAVRRTTGKDLPPIFDLTDRSINNTLAVLENWSGAIQFRDGLSHIFRGEFSFSVDNIQSAVTRIARATRQPAKRGSASARSGGKGARAAEGTNTPAGESSKELLPGLPKLNVPDAKKTEETVKGLAGSKSPKEALDEASALLDYLLD